MDTTMIKDKLITTLAQEYGLLLLNQTLHWNYQGQDFWGIHQMTQSHYEALFEDIDTLAEHIRAKRWPVPMGPDLFKQADVVDSQHHDHHTPSFQVLIDRYDKQILCLKSLIEMASQLNDKDTEDLGIELLRSREKMRWMIASSINPNRD